MVRKKAAALRTHRKICMVKCNFKTNRKAISSSPKIYYFAITEMLATLGICFLSDYVTVLLLVSKRA